MQFQSKHVRVRRLADCWAVATRAGDNAKKEWNDDCWFYATLQGACHKALEIEANDGDEDDVRSMRDAVKALDAAYDRIYKALDKIEVK